MPEWLSSLLESPDARSLIFGFLTVIPFAVMLRRVGKSPWLAVLAFVPLFGMALAFAAVMWPKWPAADAAGRRATGA